MPEGYRPSEEELQLGQENLEAMGITEEPTDRGIQHVDANGRVIDRTEKYANTQTIQYQAPEDGGGIENSKITEGGKVGQEYRREHPMTQHDIRLTWNDPAVGPMEVTAPAILETLGQTVKGGPDGGNQPWVHFEVTDPQALQAFANLDRAPGTNYAVLTGALGGDMEITVYGRQVIIERIGKVSVDFGADGLPVKATLHNITWSAAPAES